MLANKPIKDPEIRAAIMAVKEDEMISPEKVVEAAKPKTSPLHDYFTWEDGEAAHQWRLEQARHLIRVVVDIIELPDKSQREVRVFVSLPSDRNSEGGYRVMSRVLDDEEKKKEMLEDAMRELIRFREKYDMLKELAGIFKAIDKLPLIKRMKK
jgi:hypothetical protein